MEHQASYEALDNTTTLRGNEAGGTAADRAGCDPDIAAALKASAEYLSSSARKPLPYGPFASIADMELFLKSHYDRVALGGTVSGQPIAFDCASRPSAPAAPEVSTRQSSGAPYQAQVKQFLRPQPESRIGRLVDGLDRLSVAIERAEGLLQRLETLV